MSLYSLSNELILNLLEAARPDGFESLVLTCRRFHQVVTKHPSVLRFHNECKRKASRMAIAERHYSSDSPAYVFKALHGLAAQKSHFREYIKTIEAHHSGRPWVDLPNNPALQCKWPPNPDDEEMYLDKGGRVLQADNEPEYIEHKLFRESRRMYADTHVDAQIERLREVWPAFAKALSGYESEQEVPEILENPDSAMILFVLSSPNLEKLVIWDSNQYFTAVLGGIFRTIGTGFLPTEPSGKLVKSQTQPPVSEFLRRLKVLQINHCIASFPFQHVVPFVSFVPLQELRIEHVNDLIAWRPDGLPGYRFAELQWLTPNPLMTISKLVMRTLDTSQSNLTTFLSKAEKLKSLWLGFDCWELCTIDQDQLIRTIEETVGPSLNDLILTYRNGRSSRDNGKEYVIDFRAFSKLTRLGLHARFWEDGEERGFPVAFRTGEDGGYDFLPTTLKSIYLFKPGILKDDSYKKILGAIFQTQMKVAALEEVIIVSAKDELPSCVAELQVQSATIGVQISARKMGLRSEVKVDIAEDYLKFFDSEGWTWEDEAA